MSAQLQAPEAQHNQSATPPLQIAAISLAVRDLNRVTAFYRDGLGLGVLRQTAGEIELGADGAALVHLLHRPTAIADDPAAAGLFHTAFLLPGAADLGRWLVHARAMGLQLDGAADHLVSQAVYLSDPEGNGVEVYADRPRSEWTWTGPAVARRITMANKRLDLAGLMAQASAPWSGAPAGTRIGHVHLRVGDLARATAFYVGVLGLDVTSMGSEAAFLSTGGYHHHLGVNVWRSPGAGPRDPARAGLASVTMAASDPAVADAIARRGQADDLANTGLRDPWGTQVKITTTHP